MMDIRLLFQQIQNDTRRDLNGGSIAKFVNRRECKPLYHSADYIDNWIWGYHVYQVEVKGFAW
jgi:hypothetical protein